MEQEELIRQQQLLVEQRKMQEIQNRQSKNSTINDQTKFDSAMNNYKDKQIENSVKKELNSSAIKIDKVKSIQQSVKKNLKKTKTENLTDNQLKSTDDLQTQSVQDQYVEKQKLNYSQNDNSDDSDALSDSEPSEDNFEEELILKLIPKKYGKKKYITGNDEILQKPKKEKKKEKKQVKTELMPCLQSKRKEIEEKQKKEQQSAEKPIVKKAINNSISKTVIQRRNGILYRDVATQIMYISDGSNLSLMEIDILNHTGCKWSPIIYPGYQGQFKIKDSEQIRQPKFNENNQLNENLNMSASILLNQDIQGITSLSQKKNSIDLQKGDIQLRNSNQQLKNNSINLNLFQEQDGSANRQNLRQIGVFEYQKSLSNFKNNLDQNNEQGKTIQNILQQKIQDAKFQEPKSLMSGVMNSNFTGSNKKQQYLRQNPFDYRNGNSNENIKQKGLNYNSIMHDLNLETVQEKVNDKYDQNEDLQINLDLNEKYKSGQSQIISLKPHNINQCAQLKMKKIINGNIVHQNVTSSQINIMKPVLNISNQKSNDMHKVYQKITLNGDTHNSDVKPQQNYSTGKHQQLSLSVNTTSKNQQTLESKSSFSKVAQQILLNNSDTKKQQMNFNQHAYDDQVAQGTASNFSYNQSAKERQDNILKGQFDFLTGSYQTKYQGSDIVEKTLNKIALNCKNERMGHKGISSISQLAGGISIQNQDLNNI